MANKKKLIHLNQKKRGKENPYPQTFLIDEVIPWLVAPQQSQPPFRFTSQM